MLPAQAQAKKSPEKRPGGAPRASPRRGSSSARSAASKPASVAQTPASARGGSSVAGAGGDGDSQAAGRAADYYKQLIGRGGDATTVDTRQDWTLCQEIDALDHFNDERNKVQREKDKCMKNQAKIKEQLEAKRSLDDKCRGVWKQWRTELEDDVTQFHSEEQQKKTFKKDMAAKFNEERQKQLAECNRRHAVQKAEEKELEKEMMEMSDKAKKRQDELDAAKKSKQKAAMMHMKVEADAACERREVERQDEYKRDIKMQKEYEELLEAQERNRGAYFRSIRDKQTAMLASYEKGVGNQLAMQQERDDARAKKQSDAKQLKEKEDFEAREQWRSDLAQSGRVAVENQLTLQAKEREQRREEDQKYLDKALREAAIKDAKEDEKNRKKKEAIHANAEFIKQQILEKERQSPSRRIQLSQMDERERQLNKQKLARAIDPSREDGLQLLLAKKETEYRNMRRPGPIAMPS